MSDVVISYAREDESHAKRLVDALADSGWSIWWDRYIPPGTTFDQFIEQQLGAARCVVVIWSARSVVSPWVRAEAHYAFEHRTLVPVRIDDTEIPFVFRQVQTANLVGWDGHTSDDAWVQLRSAIASLLGTGPEQAPTPVAPARPRFQWSRRAWPLRRVQVAFISAAIMVAVTATGWLLSGQGAADVRPTPTPVPAPPTATRVLPTLEPTIPF